jgi:hypothetical protein
VVQLPLQSVPITTEDVSLKKTNNTSFNNIYLQRNVKSETVQVDEKSNEGNNESCKKSIFMTLFFTGWIFVIVEKCVSVS